MESKAATLPFIQPAATSKCLGRKISQPGPTWPSIFKAYLWSLPGSPKKKWGIPVFHYHYTIIHYYTAIYYIHYSSIPLSYPLSIIPVFLYHPYTYTILLWVPRAPSPSPCSAGMWWESPRTTMQWPSMDSMARPWWVLMGKHREIYGLYMDYKYIIIYIMSTPD